MRFRFSIRLAPGKRAPSWLFIASVRAVILSSNAGPEYAFGSSARKHWPVYGEPPPVPEKGLA